MPRSPGVLVSVVFIAMPSDRWWHTNIQSAFKLVFQDSVESAVPAWGPDPQPPQSLRPLYEPIILSGTLMFWGPANLDQLLLKKKPRVFYS